MSERGAASAHPADHSERYRSLIGSIDDGFCVIEVLFDDAGQPCDYCFLETNPAFERHTGLREVEGRCIRELAPAHESHWFEVYGRIALTGDPIRFIEEARALEERWFDVYAFRVDHPSQRHVAVLFRDISLRVRSERNARLLNEISRELLELTSEENLAPAIGPAVAAHFRLSQCAFVELDLSARVAAVGNCWHQIGVPSIAGIHPLNQFLSEEFWHHLGEGKVGLIRDVATDPRVKHVGRFAQFQIGSFAAVPLARDGTWRNFFVLCRSHPSEWPDEQIELAREVAARAWSRVERMRVAAGLRASEERLRLILENARDYAIFSLDLERRVTSWNIGAERLLGYTESEAIGRSADVIFTPEDREHGAPQLEADRACQDGRADDERWHLRKDGTRFWGSGVMMAMHDHRGEVHGLLKIMRDQTADRTVRLALEHSQRETLAALEATEQARAEAVAAGRAKDQFLATLSHELRTPLNPVLMIASAAAGDPSLSADVRADFEVVRKNIELEARLIDDMLDLTRIAQGKLSLHKTTLDVHECVRAAVEVVRPTAEEKAILLTMTLSAAPSSVHGDPARLQQVFINLLNNSIKFTARNGRVTVESRSSAAGKITVSISDTGIGLTHEELARAFQPFAQGSHAGESGSAIYGGLGLGLAIAEELVTRHDGVILATSGGRGHGATFSIELPLVTTARKHETRREPDVSATEPPPLSILIVEDHAHTRDAVARLLQRRGHRVATAGTKAEALKIAARHSWDLLISDIGLPDGDGIELLETLRRQTPDLPAIALSGFGMENDLRRSSAAGFSAHLVKPISIAKLGAAIAQLNLRARAAR